MPLPLPLALVVFASRIRAVLCAPSKQAARCLLRAAFGSQGANLVHHYYPSWDSSAHARRNPWAPVLVGMLTSQNMPRSRLPVNLQYGVLLSRRKQAKRLRY